MWANSQSNHHQHHLLDGNRNSWSNYFRNQILPSIKRESPTAYFATGSRAISNTLKRVKELQNYIKF
jgi:hypothetical protein